MSARRLLRQAGWHALEQGAAIATQLALTAWMIRCLSLDSFGLWILALAVLNLGSLVSFGLGAALMRHLAQDEAKDAVLAWVATAARLFVGRVLIATGLVAACLTAQTAFFPMDGSATLDALRDLTVQTLPALPCAILLQESGGLLASALRARQRYATLGQIELLHQMLWASVLGLSAWITRDVAAVLTVMPWLVLLRLLLLARVLWFEAGARWTPLRPDETRAHRLSVFSRWQGLRTLGVLMLSSLDRLLVGALLGTSALAVYAVCNQLAAVIARGAAIALQPLFVWSSRQKDLGVALRRHLASLRWMQAGIIVAAALYLPVAWKLLPLWLGTRSEGQYLALSVAVLASALTALHVAPAQLLVGSGENRAVAFYSLFGGAVSLLAMVSLSEAGLIGVMAARCLQAVVLLRCWTLLRQRITAR